MSRKLNVASALLFILGVWMLLEGLMALFSTEWYLDMWIGMMNEEFRAPNVSDIDALDPKLLNFMTFVTHGYGFLALCAGLFICVTTLIPYRKGEKWAWYAMLVIGGIYVFGMLAGTYIGMNSHLPVTMIMVILWIVGLALPAKEILHKPS